VSLVRDVYHKMDCCGWVNGDNVIFFFFQAEDGIRDYKVTGVQTCALPILPQLVHGNHEPIAAVGAPGADLQSPALAGAAMAGARSEERRVGKECRSGGSA